MAMSENPSYSFYNDVLGKKELFFAVLEFCDDSMRNSCLTLSRLHSLFLLSEEGYKWRCERLHIERGIYHPSSISNRCSWQEIFLANWKRRRLWRDTYSSTLRPNSKAKDHFRIHVSARFKPKMVAPTNSETDDSSRKKLTLPLHQRLALIKANHKISSNKEALKILRSQGDWFSGVELESKTKEVGEEKQDGGMNPAASNGSNNLSGGVHFIDSDNDAAFLVDRIKGLRRFAFDRVLHDQCSQQDVYDASAKPLVMEFINGYNATCLVYGQTGSGKTHTMHGPSDLNLEHFLGRSDVPNQWGIVPRACHDILEEIKCRREELGFDVSLSASYIEIYGDDVHDLLRDGAPCGHSRVSAQRYVLDGSSEKPVNSLKEVLELLEIGEAQKRKAATAMNERSSRAHALFLMTLRQTCLASGISRESRLCLADLGGSEQTKKSQPFDRPNSDAVDQRERMREAVQINLGLLALKNCVRSLLQNKDYVPYADSRLTMILSSALGGDSKTSVVICGAQEACHGAETIAAMKFGQTCRGISNEAKLTNASMLKGLLERIEKAIEVCEAKIRASEQWVVEEDRRFDENGRVVDVRTRTRIVGAERLRQELTSLIHQKEELTGKTEVLSQ